MKAELKPQSLHEACRSKGFEVAFLATYNVSFPFFESVVLRALQSGGCRQIILLADSTHVGAAFEHPERRPTRAGREYLLVPVTRARTFHPKVLLQLGRSKTRLMIGSHNVTLAGYGRNVELTTRIEVDGRKQAERGLIQAAWSFLREWVDDLPQSVLDMFDAARATAHNSWIGSGAAPASAGDVSVLGSSLTGPSLISQLRDALPAPVDRISVLGPYFDSELAFIDQLRALDGQPEVVVGINPAQAELPSSAQAHSGARFVDLRAAELGSGFIHAKALVFEHSDGTKTLVTGSANPSRAAWMLPAPARNAELVVVERDAHGRVEALGLDRLPDLPELDANAWQQLAEREQARAAEDATATKPSPMILAWLDHGTTLVSARFVAATEAHQLELVDEQDECLARGCDIEIDDDLARVRFNDTTTTNEAVCLRNSATGHRAVIQHRAELETRASGSRRHQFKAALLDLETDAARLEDLFKIVSKVLDEPVIASEVRHAPKPEPAADPNSNRPTPITSFEGSIHDGARRRAIPRGRRALASTSDLSAIIEYLIYQLGIGRPAEGDDDVADVDTTDEDLGDLPRDGNELPDEGDQPEEPEGKPLTGHERAQLCQGKIRTLLQRMQTRANSVGESGDPLPAIVRTVAVLALLRHLRSCEPSLQWRPRNTSLIPANHEREFFANMCPLLYAPEHGLVDRALLDTDGVVFDELSSLHSLMTWLAADCGVDLDAFDRLDLRGREIEERWMALGRALSPLSACAEDSSARALVEEMASTLMPRPEWLRRHLAWTLRRPGEAQVRLGSVVQIPGRPGRHVVVKVEPGKVGIYVLARNAVVSYRANMVVH